MEPFLATDMPDRAEWLAAPRAAIRQFVASRTAPLVIGWPFNGTRRWYFWRQLAAGEQREYLPMLIRRQAEQQELALELGAQAVFTPCFGADLLQRGEAYVHGTLAGLLSLADDAVCQRLFAQGVRMRFYGDYRRIFDRPPFRSWLDACDRIMAETDRGDGPIIFLGLFADQPYPTIAELSIDFAREHGRAPSLAELRQRYYGVPVGDLSLYIGFEQAAVFDVPLLATGLEDLYVTLNPSPDVSEAQLREILYDHLVLRHRPEIDYRDLDARQRRALVEQIDSHHGETFGVGELDAVTGLWRPRLEFGESGG